MTQEQHAHLVEMMATMTEAFARMTERFEELIARVDSYSVQVEVYTSAIESLRGIDLRKTINGLRDTEPPPTTGPSDETPPKGWKLTQQ